MKRTFSKPFWKEVTGASKKPKRLKLLCNDDGLFVCPILNCESDAYKSQRGCRKHVYVKHGWFYYFDEKPCVEASIPTTLLKGKPNNTQRCRTSNIPSFSYECSVAVQFTDWLCSAGGGGKDLKQAKQICIRVLKFAKFCCNDVPTTWVLSLEILEYCIGSVNLIEKFIKYLKNDWSVGNSGIIGYLQSLLHYLDFIRYNGVQAEKIPLFMATEVYISRAKKSVNREMRIEWNTLLSVEHFESLNCWATLKDLQRVVPYHIQRYNQIVINVKSDGSTSHDLTFATSFIVVLLFLKVKGSRPMTFQYLTLDMFECACNKGLIDQTFFKTKGKYGFDSLIFTEEVLILLKQYVDYIRPRFNPTCNFLLVCRNGSQLKNLGDILGRLTYQAIGKYINPTRYRQIIETESVKHLSTEKQAIITLDQKHTSNVARVHYQKLKSRDVARKANECVEMLIAESNEKDSNEHSMNIVSKSNDFEIEKTSQKASECVKMLMADSQEKDHSDSIDLETEQMTRAAKTCNDHLASESKRKKKCPFSKQEDGFLLEGIRRYGNGKWSSILKDPEYIFHSSRRTSTLMLRAKTKKYI